MTDEDEDTQDPEVPPLPPVLPEVKRLDISQLPEQFRKLGLTPSRWVSYLPEIKRADGLAVAVLARFPGVINHSLSLVNTMGLDVRYITGFRIGWDNGPKEYDDVREYKDLSIRTQLSPEYMAGRADGAAAATLCGLPDMNEPYDPTPRRRS